MSTVVDTMILHYFLLVERLPLLLALLDPPVLIPRVVLDPDEGEVADKAASEIRQNINYEHLQAASPGATDKDREAALENVRRLEALSDFLAEGKVEVADMTESELKEFARLTAADPEQELGLLVALGRGEAAAVAMAVNRDATLATDDAKALEALQALDEGHAYERIRRLLIRAANEDLITKGDANEIHQQMQDLNFWDHELPFPDDA